MYQFTNDEKRTLKTIRENPYMKRTLDLIEERVSKSKLKPKDAYKSVFDDLCEILNEAKTFVDGYLTDRKKKGEITDEKQAIKSIAGNSFSQALIFIFLKNKELENIRDDIFITSQTSKVPSFDKISVIDVDGETQKPDCDLVIYSLNEDQTLKKCMILSLKTSLRERASQTYKWKLLMEIATSDNVIREKYNISYSPKILPKICFATVNFYDEINQPQHRGMFKFFDQSFIAKHIKADFIARLSSLPDYVNKSL
jgi:type II restriction enzyme